MEILSRIGFGCVGLSAQPSLKSALYLLNTAYENGIRIFDTAPVYGQGYSEVILGKFIADKKDKVTITTKFGLGDIKNPIIPSMIALPLNFIRKQGTLNKTKSKENDYKKIPHRIIQRKQLESDFQLSLKRLRIDCIDNYLLHEGTPDFLNSDALEFLFEMKQKGFIKKLGMGVCHKNLIDISQNELNNWDILQYESNYLLDTGFIYNRLINKEHIHHSVLKNIREGENAGHLMAKHLLDFPKSKILFSSSKKENIVNNLKHMIEFYIKKSR